MIEDGVGGMSEVPALHRHSSTNVCQDNQIIIAMNRHYGSVMRSDIVPQQEIHYNVRVSEDAFRKNIGQGVGDLIHLTIMPLKNGAFQVHIGMPCWVFPTWAIMKEQLAMIGTIIPCSPRDAQRFALHNTNAEETDTESDNEDIASLNIED